MTHPTGQQVLRLYRNLLKYGNQLQFTDKWYYTNRIRDEFKTNKKLKTTEEIEFSFKRRSCFNQQTYRLKVPMLQRSFSFLRLCTHTNNLRLFTNKSTVIDFTRVPKLKDEDLEEQFVRGSGPGGQAVNKTANCVILKHIPSGIQVKCHATRMLHENRKEARRLLITKLDNLWNGDDSVEAQRSRVFEKKHSEANRRRRKSDEMKRRWKERENLDET